MNRNIINRKDEASDMPTLQSQNNVVLESMKDILRFDKNTGKLLSFLSKSALDQEFLLFKEDIPVFVVQYLDDSRKYRQLSSDQAQKIKVNYQHFNKKKEASLTVDFKNLAGKDIDVFVRVSVSVGDQFSHWSISLRNNAGLLITDVQFPFIVVPYNLKGVPNEEYLLQPLKAGKLFKAPQPENLEPDSPNAWQLRPENGPALHYPGLTFAQFLAYYNNRAGIYISCQDTEGRIKLIKPVHHGSGIRLGISHVGDWPQRGERTLEYDVILSSFTGDWYDAAAMYRDWSTKQKWAEKALCVREDVPSWMLDSPPHIIVRLQGVLDTGPAEPNMEFLPYSKISPLLQNIADYIKAPLVPVIMSWERSGPWVYPDCFPPVGGDDSLYEFCQMAKKRGWHIGIFCSGTRWVIGHFWSNYDGEEYFTEHEGNKTVCITHDQIIWKEHWDNKWRPSYPCCIHVKQTRDIAKNSVKKLMELGLDWIQFLDQNFGVSTFPCFSIDHGHPPVPGKWMTEKMVDLLNDFHNLARDKKSDNREFAFSVECSPCEYFLPYFQICDVRVIPPGHQGYGENFIPLFHFLYHEFIIIQGGFGHAPEPYHLPIKNAYNLVIGEIPGGVLKGDGRLLNKDTINWAPWNPQIGSNEDALEMLRTSTVLRRGKAKDFLVYGRMQRPADITNIKTVRWQNKGLDHQIPAVFHSAWQSPEGHLGLVFANWTTEEQSISINDSRLGSSVLISISAEEEKTMVKSVENGKFDLFIPPLSCFLVVGININSNSSDQVKRRSKKDI